ncbi:hypothetical protein [Brevundimonas sp.]|uniref:hypothetical protein n=1 Tax=Brevundimonas sp. TaxID=1871086 RepID=UPI003D0A8764
MTQARPSRVWPTRDFGRGEAIQARLGIDLISGELLAAIIIFAANIEFHLEGAIWKLRGQAMTPKPDTDTKVTDRLRLFDVEVANLTDDNQRKMLETWSKATRSGFIIRNNIVHGVTIPFPTGGTMMMRNPQWGGVQRKQSFGSFSPDDSVLRMTRDSFATLFRVIHALAADHPNVLMEPLASRALNEARSMLGEFADHTYGPHHEKY